MVPRIYNLTRMKFSDTWLTVRKEFLSTRQRAMNSFCCLLPFNEWAKFLIDGDKNVETSFQNLDQELHKATSSIKLEIQKLYSRKQTQISHFKVRILTASFTQTHSVLLSQLGSSEKQIRCARNVLGEGRERRQEQWRQPSDPEQFGHAQGERQRERQRKLPPTALLGESLGGASESLSKKWPAGGARHQDSPALAHLRGLVTG